MSEQQSRRERAEATVAANDRLQINKPDTLGHKMAVGAVEAVLEQLERAEHERNALAEAIRNAAVKAGICRADAALSGPHLLMLASDMADCIVASAPAAPQLSIGFANNDQGVHVSIMQPHPDGSTTVLHQAKVPAGDSFARFTLGTEGGSLAMPPACEAAVHQDGAVVAVLDGGMLAVEGLVKEANRKAPGVDWHYFAGRAVVKTLGDVKTTRQALERAIPRFLDHAPSGGGGA